MDVHGTKRCFPQQCGSRSSLSLSLEIHAGVRMEVVPALILWSCELDVLATNLSAVGHPAQHSIPSPRSPTNHSQ